MLYVHTYALHKTYQQSHINFLIAVVLGHTTATTLLFINYIANYWLATILLW